MITDKKIAEAVAILKKYEPPEGYYVAFSGGKDSLCIYWLTKIAEVKADYHYNMTTVDPPELVRFIKTFDDVKIDHPGVDKTMWALIAKKGIPPTRMVRYCCRELKEGGGQGRLKVLGVREEESFKRRGRAVLQLDRNKMNIIYHWTEKDVWEFIRWNLVDYCELYDQGWERLGCVGCPQAYVTKQEKEFERYPLYLRAYVTAFKKMLEVRREKGIATDWKDEVDVLDWWVYGNTYISKKRLAAYPRECQACHYVGHKLICEFYCDLISNKDFLKNV